MNPDATGSRRNRNSRGEPDGPEEPGQVGQAGTARAGRAGRRNRTGRRNRNSRVGPAGPEIPKRAEQAGTGRNRKSPERKTAPGLIVTDRRGYNNSSDRGRTPGASPNHRTHPSSTGRILAPRPRASGSSRVHHQTTGRILPQPAASLSRPRASGSSRAHPAPPNTTLLNCRTAKPPNCQTAEHRRVRRRSPLALVARGRGTGVLLEVLAEEGLR